MCRLRGDHRVPDDTNIDHSCLDVAETGTISNRGSHECPIPGFQLMHTVSLGPVPEHLNSKLLLPSRRRAILPHDCDKRYGRDEYASDVSDTDAEPDIIIGRVSCLRNKSNKLRHNRRITFHHK